MSRLVCGVRVRISCVLLQDGAAYLLAREEVVAELVLHLLLVGLLTVEGLLSRSEHDGQQGGEDSEQATDGEDPPRLRAAEPHIS